MKSWKRSYAFDSMRAARIQHSNGKALEVTGVFGGDYSGGRSNGRGYGNGDGYGDGGGNGNGDSGDGDGDGSGYCGGYDDGSVIIARCYGYGAKATSDEG